VNDRYLFDGLVRWDGSSLFGPESRCRRLPGVGAYRLSQDFHINGIDELKLRGSLRDGRAAAHLRCPVRTYAVVGGIPASTRSATQRSGRRFRRSWSSAPISDFLGHFSLDYSTPAKETKDQIMLVPLSFGWVNADRAVGGTCQAARAVLATVMSRLIVPDLFPRRTCPRPDRQRSR